MIAVAHPFSEEAVAEAYDGDFDNMLRLWDGAPVQHAGVFDGSSRDYRAAAERATELLVAEAGIGHASRVLDVGCGCGDLVRNVFRRFGCSAVGVDLSLEHINHARSRNGVQDGLGIRFEHGSATQLPYADGSFSHVVSQDALYHVANQDSAFAEISRVLEPGGVLACTDFLEPVAPTRPRVRAILYESMLRNGGHSFVGYQVALESAGLRVEQARDLSRHMRASYLVLAKIARQRALTLPEGAERASLARYAESCAQIQAAIERREFGWGMYVARKVEN